MSLRGLAVIEDSDEDFAAMRRALRDGPETLVRYRSGEEALDSLADAEIWPAVMILDLNLPGASGLDVLRTVRAEPKLERLPVVMLSGSSRSEDVTSAYEAGANAYVIKPLDFEDMRASLLSVWRFWNLAIVPMPGRAEEPGYGLL